MEAMPNAVRCMGNGVGRDRAARKTSPQTVVFHKWTNFSTNVGLPQVEEETSWMEAMPNAVKGMGKGIVLCLRGSLPWSVPAAYVAFIMEFIAFGVQGPY